MMMESVRMVYATVATQVHSNSRQRYLTFAIFTSNSTFCTNRENSNQLAYIFSRELCTTSKGSLLESKLWQNEETNQKWWSPHDCQANKTFDLSGKVFIKAKKKSSRIVTKSSPARFFSLFFFSFQSVALSRLFLTTQRLATPPSTNATVFVQTRPKC